MVSIDNSTRLFIEGSSLTEPRTSGIANTTLNIVKGLDVNGQFKVNLIIPFNKAKFLERYNLSNSIRIRKLYIPGRVMNLLTRLNLVPYIDLIFGFGVYVFPNYRNWPLFHSKNVTYIHDMTFVRYPEFVRQSNLEYIERNIKTWLKRADKIAVVSRFSKDEIDYFFPESKDKTFVVYNGIDTSLFSPSDRVEDSLFRSLNVVPHKYLLFLSNLEPRKNITRLLEAFNLYKTKNNDKETKLLLVGGMDWNNDSIVEKIKEINQEEISIIRPKRFIEDKEIPILINNSIGLVAPSLYEGFGIAPLQALSCGKNVVVSDLGVFREVVGNFGIFVNPADVESIEKGIEKLINLKDTKNIKGLEQSKKFTWEQSLKPLFEAITQLSS